MIAPAIELPREGVRAAGAKRTGMGIRHRATAIDRLPAGATDGLAHLPAGSGVVLRWLAVNRVEFVLVGAVARAVRGERQASGAVAIVPAPYRRNVERLVRACAAAHARARTGSGPLESPGGETLPVRLTTAKLLDAGRWRLRVGTHDLDVEGRPRGAPLYQELLYEAERVALAPDLEIEVASIEGVEVYDHIARTGVPPEIRVIRRIRELDAMLGEDPEIAFGMGPDTASAPGPDPTSAPGPDPTSVPGSDPTSAPVPDPTSGSGSDTTSAGSASEAGRDGTSAIDVGSASEAGRDGTSLVDADSASRQNPDAGA